jgi:surfeit locus 1 family protein
MKKLLPLLISSAIGITILCALGTWQVFRLAEKTKLIATLEERMKADPITLTQAMERQAKGEPIEYLKVTIEGRSDPAHALNKITSVNGKPGWEVIVPFTTNDGILVLVDSGATTDKNFASISASNEIITGIVRIHNKGRGLFDNDNDEADNIWYWWDLPAMQAAAQATVDAKIAPFIVQKLPLANDGAVPLAQTPKVELSNNHLGYAITWFGLAAALLAVSGFFARSLVLDRHRREG